MEVNGGISRGKGNYKVLKCDTETHLPRSGTYQAHTHTHTHRCMGNTTSTNTVVSWRKGERGKCVLKPRQAGLVGWHAA